MGLKEWLLEKKDELFSRDTLKEYTPEAGSPRIVLTPDKDGVLRASNTPTAGYATITVPIDDSSLTDEEQIKQRIRHQLLNETVDARGQRMFRWITSWPVFADKWPYSFGTAAKFATCGASCLYILKHYRRHFRLGRNARNTIWLAGALAPSIFNIVFHREFVVISMLGTVVRKEPCPVCYEMRALSIQLVNAYLFPATAGLLVILFAARRHMTAPAPSFIPFSRQNTKFALAWVGKTMKPALFGPVGLTAFGLNVAFIAFWSHFEFYSMHKIAMKMRTHRELVSVLGEKEGRFKEFKEKIPPRAISRSRALGEYGKKQPQSVIAQESIVHGDDAGNSQFAAATQEPLLPAVPEREENRGWLSFLTRSSTVVLDRSHTTTTINS